MAEHFKPIEVTLRDGQQVAIRPVQAGDKQALNDGLKRLSKRSRYLRFMSPIREFSGDQLRYLTELDHRDHMAWAAFEPRPGGLGLGIARYVRDPDQPEVAEAAVTVVDSHHGLGLGTLLLRQLSCSAHANGIRRFRGYVLEENQPMLRILYELGADIQRQGDGLLQVLTEIPDNIEDLADTSTLAVFRAVAREHLPPMAVRFLHEEISRVVKLFSAAPRDSADEKK